MSIRKEIYDVFKTIKNNEIMFKSVGIWHSEMIEPERLQQFNTPAVFIEFTPVNYEQCNPTDPNYTGERTGKLNFNIHILSKHNGSELDNFELTETLRDSVLRFATILFSTNFSQPVLISENTDDNSSIIHRHEMSFYTEFVEAENKGYSNFEAGEGMGLDYSQYLTDYTKVYEFATLEENREFVSNGVYELN